MSPKKLFDYLDGKLTPQERAELESQLAADSALQRELAIARQIHDGMGESSEVIGTLGEDPGVVQRGAILGRRVAAAFAVLIFLNVGIGLWFIFRSQAKPTNRTHEDVVRQQIEQSAEQAAAAAIPTPVLESDEIKIHAAPAEVDLTVQKIIDAAKAAGGSAAKALADENGTIVLADVPEDRETDFRARLKSLHAEMPPEENSKPVAPNHHKFLQIRIVSAEPAPHP